MSTENLPLTFSAGGLTYVNRSVADLQSIGVADATILSGYAPFLSARIDADAEMVRSQVITANPGQVMEYDEAHSEAVSALAASGPVAATSFPMLAATIGVDVDPSTSAPATDVLGVARAVMAAYASWAAVGAAIRGVRVKGKAAVAAATTVAAATAAYQALAWPSTSGTATPPSA